MDESLKDPRIKQLGDKIIWVKVNSEKEKDLHEFYRQKGFPLIVILSSEGEEIKRFDGYRPANVLSADLKKIIAENLSQTRITQLESR